MILLLAAVSLSIWIYLVFARGWFWLGRERDDGMPPRPATLPTVAIVVPARNEAENVAQSVASLLRQDYPAALVLVDDDSDDGTADVAWRAAASLGASQRLTVIIGRPLPPQWTGKLWAVKQGIAAAEEKLAPK
jgi:cellulose synthase/poly-beta-1,6-N-acetylglucosamine synthase-like glycosyltransferase